MSAMGMASGHLVKRSMHVSKYVYPREDGNDQWYHVCQISDDTSRKNPMSVKTNGQVSQMYAEVLVNDEENDVDNDSNND